MIGVETLAVCLGRDGVSAGVQSRWGALDRWVMLTAGMGAGHDQVAAALAGRIRDRGDQVLVVDLLEVLPAGVGRGLRNGYAGMLRAAPWLYESIFRVFFCEHRFGQPGVYPLDALAARRLRALSSPDFSGGSKANVSNPSRLDCQEIRADA